MYYYAGLHLIPPFVLYVPSILALMSFNVDFRSVTVTLLLCICSPFTPKDRGHSVAQLDEALLSIPDGVIGIFHLHNPSGRTMSLRWTQPLKKWLPELFPPPPGGGGKGSRGGGLPNLPPSCNDCLKIWDLQLFGTLRAYPCLYRDCFTFTFTSSPKSDSRFHAIFATGRLEKVPKCWNFSFFRQQMLMSQKPCGLIWRWKQ